GPVPWVNHGLVKVTRHAVTLGPILLQPASRGSISLRSADPLAAPCIQPSYLSDPEGEDLRALVDGVELARRVLGAPALARVQGEPVGPGPEARSRADPGRVRAAKAGSPAPPAGPGAI